MEWKVKVVVSMDLGRLDQMTEHALEVLAGDDPAQMRRLVRNMAQSYASDPALAIAFALTSAASALEDMVRDEKGSAARAYKLSALVAADVMAVQAMGKAEVLGGDLLYFWRRVDPYFLKL